MNSQARGLQKSRSNIVVACCVWFLLFSLLAGCGTGEYERRLNANLNSLGAAHSSGSAGAAGLSDYQDLEDYPQYEIRVPEGYSAPTIVEENPNFRIQWLGQTRADQSAPELQVRILEPLPGTAAPALDEVMTQQIETLSDSFDDVNPSATQSVALGGIDFLRVGWSGTDKTGSLPVQGFLYVAIDAGLIIHIQWHDGFDEADETMDAAYAAADSFRPS